VLSPRPFSLSTSRGNQDSGCKLLKNRLRAAWHQQKNSKIVLLGPTNIFVPSFQELADRPIITFEPDLQEGSVAHAHARADRGNKARSFVSKRIRVHLRNESIRPALYPSASFMTNSAPDQTLNIVGTSRLMKCLPMTAPACVTTSKYLRQFKTRVNPGVVFLTVEISPFHSSSDQFRALQM
jgi:hypothetical protein